MDDETYLKGERPVSLARMDAGVRHVLRLEGDDYIDITGWQMAGFVEIAMHHGDVTVGRMRVRNEQINQLLGALASAREWVYPEGEPFDILGSKD